MGSFYKSMSIRVNGEPFMSMGNKKCTCGEAAIGGANHSKWCDLLRQEQIEETALNRQSNAGVQSGLSGVKSAEDEAWERLQAVLGIDLGEPNVVKDPKDPIGHPFFKNFSAQPGDEVDEDFEFIDFEEEII